MNFNVYKTTVKIACDVDHDLLPNIRHNLPVASRLHAQCTTGARLRLRARLVYLIGVELIRPKAADRTQQKQTRKTNHMYYSPQALLRCEFFVHCTTGARLRPPTRLVYLIGVELVKPKTVSRN